MTAAPVFRRSGTGSSCREPYLRPIATPSRGWQYALPHLARSHRPQHAQAPPVDRETQRPALTTTVCFASCDGVRALPPLKPPRGRRPRHLMSLDRIAESANHIRVAMITPSPAVMADKSGVTSTSRYSGWVSNNTMRQWRYLRIPTISCGRLFATSLA